MIKKKIVITGGHLTPAVAVIEKLIEEKNWEIFYFGRKYNFEGKRLVSEEYNLIPKLGVKFLVLKTGRLQRQITPYFLLSLLKIPVGFFQALIYLMKIRPRVVLSFGSYVSTPVVLSAWVLRIPVVSHEQTASPGLANRINFRFSALVTASYKEGLSKGVKAPAIVIGNPIRKAVFQRNKTVFGREVTFISRKLGLPVIYITGGNQGAVTINQVVREILPKLLRKFIIIHQVGNFDLNPSQSFANQLSEVEQERYFVKSFILGEEIGWIFNKSSLIISRAGANISWELGATGKPAILIPLPSSEGDEQAKNALKLANLGSVKIINQKDLIPEKLLLTINEVFLDLEKYRKMGEEARKFYHQDGSEKLVKQLRLLFKKK